MDVAAGTMLGGYRVERKLGGGGMGVVYLARQVSLDRLVAVKLIAPAVGEDEAFRQRFLTESRVAASIDHPNVIPVHEASEDGGRLFVAMRYVDGPDLAALLRAERRLQPDRAARIVAQVAAALDAAHAHGMVHRDVKPANVLVADPGATDHCYLTDFGLVKRSASTSGLTLTGQVMGTASYIAPEQLRGATVDARTDVYSLGCVLFELLTGRAPFERDTDVATLWAHLSESAPAPSDVVPSLPRSLDAVVARAMAKDPDERYGSAGALGSAALEAAGAGTRAVAPTAPATAPVAPPAPAARAERRLALPVAGAVAVAVAVVAAILLVRGGDDEPPPRADAPALEVVSTVAVGGIPVTASAGFRRVWATLQGESHLAVLDPATGALSESRRYATNPLVTAVDASRLWVGDLGKPDDGRGRIVEVDPDSGRVVRRIPTAEPVAMAADDDSDSVWLTDLTDTVQRVDVRRGRVTAEHEVRDAFEVVVLAGRAWVVAGIDGELVPFDAATGREAGRPVPVGARPVDVAAAGGALWVVTEPGRLVRVDPATRDTQPFPIGAADPQRKIAAANDRLWVFSITGELVAIDPARPERRIRLDLGGELLDVAQAEGGAFVLRVSPESVGEIVRVKLSG